MFTPGTRIGPYEVVGWLGAGGMGEVYRARDPRLGRDVALKLIAGLSAADANRVRRFEQEARAAGQLNHPNILAVHDAGIHDGAPYIVAELLEGESLRARLQNGGALPLRKAIDYARQTAEGLAAAHDKGIVHRDVKPDNLFITSDGRIKILDFGIAKLTQDQGETNRPTGLPTDTAAGTVVGTVGYMSPEQVRGEEVDGRSDLFSAGTVLHEMLTGKAPFSRGTAADTMAAILKEEPAEPLPAGAPPALARIVSRCLEKSREARFQSARDLAFGLDVLSGTGGTAAAAPASAPWSRGLVIGAIILGITLLGLAAAANWHASPAAARSIDSLLLAAKYTQFTDFEGSEIDAAISPDGRFVAFMADRDGPYHVWVKQVGTGPFKDLTQDQGSLLNVGPNRSVGFSPEGPEVWVNGSAGRRLTLIPLMGGPARPFLIDHTVNVAWSPDGSQLAYFTFDGDPLIVADRTGEGSRRIIEARPGDHNHFPAWSPDSQWIYYMHSVQSVSEYDLWRIPSAGGRPEQLTRMNADLRYATPIDNNTVLFVAPDQDRSGPWLWVYDVPRNAAHRVSAGLDRYLSIAASADGRRLVAAVAKSTAGLWSVPMLDRVAEEADVKPYPLPAARGLAPRFGPAALFYLSASGAGDGLWRLQDGNAVEVWNGGDGPLVEAPAISPRGDRAALVVSKQGKLRLTILSADGTDRRSPAPALEVRGSSSWSPDGTWLVTGGSDAHGSGLFKIPVAGGDPVRIVSGVALNPVWSSDGDLIVYAGQQDAFAPLLAVRPDGHPVALPKIRVPTGGRGGYRFLADGKSLVYLQSQPGSEGLWLLQVATGQMRQIARLSRPASTTTFDIAPDGKSIVFDRVREHSDIELIDLPK